MTKGQYVQKASEGGLENAEKIPFEALILMPEAWKAVGKVEGWDEKMVIRRSHIAGNWGAPAVNPVIFEEIDYQMDYVEGWKIYMHRMIDALVEGKTIEQFLETL